MRNNRTGCFIIKEEKGPLQDEGDIIARMVIISQDDVLDTLRMRENKTGCFIVKEDAGTNYRT